MLPILTLSVITAFRIIIVYVIIFFIDLFYRFLFVFILFYHCVFPFRVCVVSEHPSGGDLKLMGIGPQEENIKNEL